MILVTGSLKNSRLWLKAERQPLAGYCKGKNYDSCHHKIIIGGGWTYKMNKINKNGLVVKWNNVGDIKNRKTSNFERLYMSILLKNIRHKKLNKIEQKFAEECAKIPCRED